MKILFTCIYGANLAVQLGMDYCPLYGVAGCPLFRVSNAMDKRSDLSELSVMSCGVAPLRGVRSTICI